MFSSCYLKNTARLLSCRNDFPLTVIREDSDLVTGHAVHRHEDYELRIIVAPHLPQIQRMDLILPRVCHDRLIPEENDRSISISFSSMFFYFRYLNVETVQFRSVFSTAVRELLRQVPAADLLELRLTLALFLLKSELVCSSCPVSERLDTVIRYMEQHYYRTDLSISFLAGMVGYSPSYLQKIFRDSVGCNPKEYLLKIRMDTAAKFLREKRYLIKEIAVLCGFSDSHYFSNVFREYYNCTPRDFLRLRQEPLPGRGAAAERHRTIRSAV